MKYTKVQQKIHEKVKIEEKLKIEFTGKDIFMLHKELGKGNHNGRDCRLLQTNKGLHFEIKEKKGWKTYTATYDEISKTFARAVIQHEKEEGIQ